MPDTLLAPEMQRYCVTVYGNMRQNTLRRLRETCIFISTIHATVIPLYGTTFNSPNHSLSCLLIMMDSM